MSIFDLITQPIKAVTKKPLDLVATPVQAAAPEYWIRNNKITEADLNEAKAVLFGEISNRSSEKQKLEAQTILNTAFNRMDEYSKRGTPKSLTEVLQMPNQYQAYGGKEYNRYKSGQTKDTDKQKLDAIEETLKQIRDLSFQNNIGESVFYTHKPGGRIIATNDKLYK